MAKKGAFRFTTILLSISFVIYMPIIFPVYGVTASQTFLPVQKNKNDCSPVDIIFLIDTSPDINSPINYQKRSIEWLIDFMAHDRLLNCPNVVHRIGYIGINNPAKNFLALTPINPNVDDPNFSSIWASSLSTIMHSMPMDSEYRNFDNLNTSLRTAVDLLNNAPQLGQDERKKAIILVVGADGVPCDYISHCTQGSRASDSNQKKMAAIIDNLNDLATFSVIILGDGSFNNSNNFDFKNSKGETYTQFWQSITKNHNGELHTSEKADIYMPKFFMDQFLSLSPRPDVVNFCGSAPVDPLLNNVGFSVFSEKPVTDQIIQYPSSTPIRISDASIQGSHPDPNNVNYFLFHHPPAGQWNFAIDCDNNKAIVYMDMERANLLQLDEPKTSLPQYENSNSPFDPDNQYFLKFKIVDSKGEIVMNPLDLMPKVTGSLTLPDGTIAPVPLEFHYSADGIYISNDPLTTNQATNYQVQLSVSVPSADRKHSDAFQIKQNFTYTVTKRIPFTFELISPKAAAQIPVHGNLLDHWMKVKPIQIEVRLKPVHDQDDVTRAIRGDQNKTFKAILLSPDLKQEEIWLSPNPTEPLTYVGLVGGGFDLSGNYSLGIEYSKTYNESQFFYQANESTSNISFQREDGILELPQFYWTLMAIVCMLLLALLLYEIWINTNRVTGYLLFVPPGKNMAPFHVMDLSKKKRRNVSFGSEEMKNEHFLLSNIQRINIRTPGIFGKSQLIHIKDMKEDENEKSVAKQKDEDIFIKRTDGFYDVIYTANRPENEKTPLEKDKGKG